MKARHASAGKPERGMDRVRISGRHAFRNSLVQARPSAETNNRAFRLRVFPFRSYRNVGIRAIKSLPTMPRTLAAIDRMACFARNCCPETRPHLKRAILIAAAVVLAPLLVLSLAVRATSEWQTIGQTPRGDTVAISSVRVLRNNLRVALVRVDYKNPAQLPQGGPFLELRARVHFNCVTGAATPTTEWFYSRDRNGRYIVTRKTTHDNQFGQALEGGFADLVSKNVCSQSK